MSQPVHIFVYGTLRPPRAGTPPADSKYYPEIAEQILAHQPATLTYAELYDLGAYPAAVPGDGVIRGDLLEVAADALSIADRIEGHPTFFRRERVTVQTANGEFSAWVYWAPPGLHVGRRRISSGDWFARHADAPEPSAAGNEAQSADPTPVDPTLRTLVQRFAEADCSWLSSVRPDGRAHSAPVWHVWYRGRAYVVTTARAVKTANIARNPSVVIAHPDPHDSLIIEGWATTADSLGDAPDSLWHALRPLFREKYDWDICTDEVYDTIIEITPTKLMAWGKYGEGRWGGADLLRVW